MAGVDMDDLLVVAPNFKQRLSGVTTTIVHLVPLQAKMIGIATLGPASGLPDNLPKMRWRQLPALLRRPRGSRYRVWHARRNVEMLGGAVLRYLFRAPLKLLFTSASQREHTGWTRFLVRRMDAVVATSRKTAAYLQVPNTVIMHGIDAERFHVPDDRGKARADVGLDPDRLYAGCFGRVRRQKGTDLFVDAMIRLLPQHPQWSAIIAGRTTVEHRDFERGLRERIAAAGLADRILFVGEHRDIERWYRALSLFVAPQRWEGFGLTPLEAMASGVPVVAADVGAFSELIEQDRTGVVVPADDLGAMTAAADAYMRDAGRCEAEGAAGRDHVSRNFALETEAVRLVEIYRRLANGEDPGLRPAP